MKISYNWLKKYGALERLTDKGTPSPEEFAKKIDQVGYTVEKITYLTSEDGVRETDAVIDLRIPRRRSDMNSMMWTVKELCGIYDVFYHDLATYGMYMSSEEWVSDVTDETDLHLYSTSSRCQMICGRIINHITTTQSPGWLKDKIIANGYTPQNLLEDLTNFEARNLGQPFYVLDLSKLDSKEIAVEDSLEDGSIISDGIKYYFKKGDLIITNQGRPISICGVVFDDSVKVDENTKSIVILSVVFDVDTVRRTLESLEISKPSLSSKVAAIGSEAGSAMKAIYNATCVLHKFADANSIEALEIYNKYDMAREFTSTSVEELNGMLSTDFTFEEIEHALGNPELNTYLVNGGRTSTMFPSYRTDRKPCDIAQSLLIYLGCGRIKASK